jgi:hypothetical protein
MFFDSAHYTGDSDNSVYLPNIRLARITEDSS